MGNGRPERWKLDNKRTVRLTAPSEDKWLIMADRQYTTGTGGPVQLPVDAVKGSISLSPLSRKKQQGRRLKNRLDCPGSFGLVVNGDHYIPWKYKKLVETCVCPHFPL